jgi:hypothetical protein
MSEVFVASLIFLDCLAAARELEAQSVGNALLWVNNLEES